MIKTQRTVIKLVTQDLAAQLFHYHLENKEHLRSWQPLRQDAFYQLSYWKEYSAESEIEFADAKAVRLAAINPDIGDVIGICNFTGISRGAFQACFLGYSISSRYEGQGYMTEILESSINYMFDTVGLNRIMASYMPKNKASGTVLRKLGFEREGYARNYLKIDGKWEDHILTSKVREI